MAGLSRDIAATWAACAKCMQEVPSQLKELPEAVRESDFAFKKLSADYFEVRGMQDLVVVDWYSSWPMVYRATDLSAGELVRVLRRVFTSYRVAEELTLDRATVFTSHVFEEIYKT